jgi:Rps23 Pro-64 3,4-dihydroxylase Tpa1-like proline 4-hydroxylase
MSQPATVILNSAGFVPLLDYANLEQIARNQAQSFQTADPFPHIMIDNFLSPELVDAVVSEIPDYRKAKTNKDAWETLGDGSVAQYRKSFLSMEMRVGRLTRQLYWELNSADFLSFLQKLTGIEGLVPDPYLLGGGIHETQRGGYLMVHADFNKHPELKLDRRLNIIIYLNRDWPDEYGGHLELWDKPMQHCVQKIAPLAGRCVIFKTGRDTWHGHPHPLNCPEDRTRQSLALYYYSNGRPVEEGNDEHLTLWQKTD